MRYRRGVIAVVVSDCDPLCNKPVLISTEELPTASNMISDNLQVAKILYCAYIAPSCSSASSALSPQTVVLIFSEYASSCNVVCRFMGYGAFQPAR